MLFPGVDLDFRGTDISDYLLKRILERLRDPANLRVRIGTARCTGASFGSGTGFEDAIFLDDAQFAGATFDHGVSFANARFERGADFAGAKFGTEALPGTTRVSFDGVDFRHGARFSGTTFDGLATFREATFGRTLSFKGAQFDTARFILKNSGGVASFQRASVSAELTLDLCGHARMLRLDGVRAAGQVDVRAEAATIRCENAAFEGRVRFLLAGGPELCLADTVFSQPSAVQSWRPPASASAPASGYGQPVRVRSVRGVDAEHLTLADADLSRCLIYGLRRPDQLRLAGHCQFAPTPRGWHLRWRFLPWRWTSREALYEEQLWRRTSVTAALGWRTGTDTADDSGAELDAPEPAGLAVLYRQLRQAVEDARNEPGAADLYYGEMEMRRLSTQRWDERWLLTMYWLVSGYGLRASRSILVLIGLVAGAAVVLQQAGFPGRHLPGYLDCLLYAAGSVLSLSLTGHLPAQLTDWGQAVRIALRIGGPVLLGLGALAIRGRVKR